MKQILKEFFIGLIVLAIIFGFIYCVITYDLVFYTIAGIVIILLAWAIGFLITHW